MQTTPTAVGRLVRPAAVGVLALALLSAPGAVHAAGTGGITVTPVPAVVDGEPVTSFRVKVPSDGQVEVPFTVANVTDEERSARLFVSEVTRNDGNLALTGADTSTYVSFPDQSVTLAPGEVREESFTVEGGDLDEEVLAGVVVEVQNGAVLQRATTLIYLEPGRQVPLPLVLVLVAVLLVSGAGAALAATVRGRRRRVATEELG